MIRLFLGAVQFLTIIPIHRSTAPPGRSALFFPLVAAWIGLLGASLLEMTRGFIPFTIAALLVLAFWAIIGGCLHEDAFADAADAFRAGRTPEKIHAILKDSHIGVYGTLALLFSALIRWQALSAISVVEYAPALAAAQAVPRSALVALGWISRPAGAGTGAGFLQTLTTPIAIAAILQGIGFAAWNGWRAAAFIVIGTAIIVIAARSYFHRRIGGVTGDCLGATAHLVEIYILLLFTCRPCIS
jgi:adenosylcobinamide-GDP ribazoletransferase